MKTHFVLLALSFWAAGGMRLQSQTLNWGNIVGGEITTSQNVPLNETFVFQLGAFFNDFVPDETNTDHWLSNWKMFDQATYDPVFGFSTSTVYIQNDVTSSNPAASTLSFAGLDAYIWIRKGDNPVEGSEWFLARSDQWKFPTVGGDCCDTTVVEWSVSDLDSGDNPEWGRQGGVTGPGVFTSTGTTGLQTHTFVPEPSSALLASAAGLGLVFRRRRTVA